ncbi:MAG: hypothetical protein WBS24_03405 [Terriglobales bacterium]
MFTLTIETHNAAFVGADDDFGPGPELARILRELADRLDLVGTAPKDGTVRDFNGNTVGTWTLEDA